MKAALNRIAWCIFVFIFAAFWICPAEATQLISVSGVQSKLGGSGDSGLAIISQDGRYVLFASTANNLTLTNNNNFVLPCRFNVFLRDTLSNTTTLVSANNTGTGGGNGDSFPTGISTNGQFALFESSASDLIVNDTNNASDIFVRDLVNGTTTLVSASAAGGNANGASRGSVITPDGRYVAFTSAATNLVSADTNNIADVFVRDLSLATTKLVSLGARTNANASIPTSSESPEITPDGRFVVFYSNATNLVAGVRAAGEIYVRDLISGKTTWASTNARAIFQSVTGSTNIVNCNYSISDNGQVVAFEACTNSSGASTRGIILRQNLQTGLTDIIHSNATVQLFSYELVHNLSMTPDGRFVTFVANLPNVSATNNAIYVWDAQTGTNMLVSVSLDDVTPANGICDSPVISANGQFVAFISSATNLVTNTLAGDRYVYIRDLLAGVTQLLDADTNGVGVGVDATTVPAMSADGSVVVFDSANLLPDNRHLVHDVFARNVTAGATSLISATNPALSSQTPDGINGFTSFSVSSNGQLVAFYSDADNLIAGDTNGYRDVFLRNRFTGINILVSVNTNGFSGDGISTDPAVSGDGRYVAFTSSADNLVVNDTNRAQDVFIRDVQAGTTALASVSTNGVNPGNGDSFAPVISADGRYVMFYSKASNLTTGSFGSGVENLFVRDLQAAMTYPLTSSGVRSAAMTPDGQSIAFVGGAVGISGARLYIWNSQLNALTYTNTSGFLNFPSSAFVMAAISPNGQKIAVIAGGATYLYAVDLVVNTTAQLTTSENILSHAGVRFSNDGRFLTYAVGSLNSAVQNVYLYDFQTATNLLVSQNFTVAGAASASSDSPTISPDGRFIAYRSFATNLVPFDFNNTADLFVYDVTNNATILISVNPTGNASAADRSLLPVFSADGRTLFFQSWAADISGNDFNNGSDLFALDLTALPLTTGNGGGATNAASGFVAQLIIPSGSASNALPVLSWPLASGKSYQVQYKTNLTEAAWLNLPGNLTFIGATGYLNDALPSSGQRFYRIILSP